MLGIRIVQSTATSPAVEHRSRGPPPSSSFSASAEQSRDTQERGVSSLQDYPH